MANRVLAAWAFAGFAERRRLHVSRDPLSPNESMEVAVLAGLGAVGVVIVLRCGLGVVHIALGIVVHLEERALMSKNLRDRVGSRFAEHAQGLEHVLTRGRHTPETLRRKTGKINVTAHLQLPSMAASAILSKMLSSS